MSSEKNIKIDVYFSSEQMQRIKEAAEFLGEDVGEFIVDAIESKVEIVENSPFPPDHMLTAHKQGDHQWSERNLVITHQELDLKTN